MNLKWIINLNKSIKFTRGLYGLRNSDGFSAGLKHLTVNK